MDTTAETLVGAADNEQRLLALALHRLRLGLLENSVGRLAIGARLGHGALRAGELGGGDDFHGLGDLLNVADGLQAAFDFAEGGVLGILRGGKGGSGRAMAADRYQCLGLISPRDGRWARGHCGLDVPQGDLRASPEGRTSSSRQHGSCWSISGDSGRGDVVVEEENEYRSDADQ